MAIVGSFGDVIFEAKTTRAQTFDNLQRSGSSKWTEHNILNYRPKMEFGGPDLEEMSFTMVLNAVRGVNPIDQIIKLRNMRDTGKNATFILGGESVSSNNWVITNLTEGHRSIDPHGNLILAEVSVSLKEYPLKKQPSEKNTTTSVTPPVQNAKRMGVMTITVKSVNIRSGPSTSNKVIGYAFRGDKLDVLSESNGWYSLGSGKYITSSSKYSTFSKG